MGFGGRSVSWQAYVGNHPLNAVDPNGTSFLTLVAPSLITGTAPAWVAPAVVTAGVIATGILVGELIKPIFTDGDVAPPSIPFPVV